MRYIEVLVNRDERLSIPRQVPAWEVPVLRLVHGEEKIEEREYIDVPQRDYPDAGDEFNRLVQRYGEDVATETPFVAMVYGHAPRGVQALAEAIQKERDAEPVSVEVEEVDPAA